MILRQAKDHVVVARFQFKEKVLAAVRRCFCLFRDTCAGEQGHLDAVQTAFICILQAIAIGVNPDSIAQPGQQIAIQPGVDAQIDFACRQGDRPRLACVGLRVAVLVAGARISWAKDISVWQAKDHIVAAWRQAGKQVFPASGSQR